MPPMLRHGRNHHTHEEKTMRITPSFKRWQAAFFDLNEDICYTECVDALRDKAARGDATPEVLRFIKDADTGRTAGRAMVYEGQCQFLKLLWQLADTGERFLADVKEHFGADILYLPLQDDVAMERERAFQLLTETMPIFGITRVNGVRPERTRLAITGLEAA
jgi:hypothetical protein